MNYQRDNFKVVRNKLEYGGNATVVQDPSRNYSRTIDPKFLVLHYTASPNYGATKNEFQNFKRASSHFTIDYDGTIHQHVDLNKAAWHAGISTWGPYKNLNRWAFGIEIENFGHMTKTEEGYFKTWFGKEVIPGESIYPNSDDLITVIEAEHKFMGGLYAWCTMTPEQVSSLIELGNFLYGKYNLQKVLTHQEISIGRKWDTGPIVTDNMISRIEGRNTETIPPTVDVDTSSPDIVIDNDPDMEDPELHLLVGFVTARTRLNMRLTPEMADNIIDKLGSGEVVFLMNDGKKFNGEWYKIITSIGSNVGYVHSSFVEVA